MGGFYPYARLCGHFRIVPCRSREARSLKSVNGVCATILDSSLRCASFRMTGGEGAGFGMTGKGRCVENDGISMGCFRNDGIGKPPPLFRLYILLSASEGEGTTWLESARANETRLCGDFPFVACHSEGREGSEVCEWCVGNDFRFFTPLRFVQNDKGKGRSVRDDREGELCSG